MNNRGKKKRPSTLQMSIMALTLIALISFLSVLALKGGTPGPELEDPAGKNPQTVLNPADTKKPGDDSKDGPEEDPRVDLKAQKNVTTILVGGVSSDNSCTDTILLVTYDGNEQSAGIMQIPRDTYVALEKGTRKINSAYGIGGGELFKETVSDLLGIPIDYYAVINTRAFRKIVDGIGGVTVTVPFDMDYEDADQDLYIHLKKGTQTLNGSDAEGFVRYRDGYSDADLGRLNAMKEFLAAFMKQCLNLKNIFKLPSFIGDVFSNLKTDVGLDDTIRMAGIALNLDMDKVTVYSLPGEACYVKAPNMSYKEWYYSIYGAEALEILNDSFNLYRAEVTLKDTGIVELSREEYDLYKGSGDTLAGIDEDGVKYNKLPKEQTKWYKQQQASQDEPEGQEEPAGQDEE